MEWSMMMRDKIDNKIIKGKPVRGKSKVHLFAAVAGAIVLACTACHSTAGGKKEEPVVQTTEEGEQENGKRGFLGGLFMPDTYEDEEAEERQEYTAGRCSYQCTEEESDEILFPIDRDIKILFAGNSLFGEPKVDKYFETLVERYSLNVEEVIREIFYGQSIRYQLSLIDDDDWDFVKEDYANADVILFQEYGGAYETTYEDIRTLIDHYCKEDVVVYYYTTQYDYRDSYLKKMAEDEQIHVLDFGTVLHRLDEDCSYLYQSDLVHPNELEGFMAAGYIYSQLYKTTFSDYPYEELPENLKELIPGESDAEKEEFYGRMLGILQAGVLRRT